MSNYTEFSPDIWSATLNANFDNTGVMDSCVNKKYEFELYAYALMKNHVHLVLNDIKLSGFFCCC